MSSRVGATCGAQAHAFAWLGQHYVEQPDGAAPARRCFQKALSIDPCLASAGAPQHP